MRVTGGKVRGLRLLVPTSVSDLRPSQDIVRESVFNILGDIKDTLVLDLYSGTGALGIESLSRGARFCDFVEKEQSACKTIEQNLKNADLIDFADVYCGIGETFITHPHKQEYDLIFLDPPYVEKPRSVILTLPKLIANHGVIVYLHGKHLVLEDPKDRELIGDKLEVFDTRRYGATHVTFLRKKSSTQ